MIPIANRDKGWISLYRSITDHWIWTYSKIFDPAHAWIDLLLDVNHEDRKITVNGEVIEIKRGQKWTSVRTLAARWGWSKNKVTRFLTCLERDSMVIQRHSKNGTLLTIVNYDDFQIQRDTDGTPTGHQRDTNGTPTGRNNNEIINNGTINKNKKGTFVPPSHDQVRLYCLESGNQIDVDAFIDFYTSKNWFVGKNKMKDWKAAVRNWVRRDKERKPNYSFENQRDSKEFDPYAMGLFANN